jgi:dihydroorotate dehydrogenase electron transfer subunit
MLHNDEDSKSIMGLSRPNKGPFNAIVSANRQIRNRFYSISLEFEGTGAEVFGNSAPGQFAQLDLSAAALPSAGTIPEELTDAAQRHILLRRPFSFCDITVKNSKTLIGILYCVLGPATLRMRDLARGDVVNVIGPLGNGFKLPEQKKAALLVAGGMGAGPLLHLAKVLGNTLSKTDVIAFAGAKTAEELPFEKRLDEISQELGFSLAEFARSGIKSLVATDDGSAGFEGTVTDCLLDWLGKSRPAGRDIIIYGCGPEPMLAKLAEIAGQRNIDCQVSMERMMACGTGLCQSCAVECKVDGSNETIYKMCCTDGPVFDSKEVVFTK